MKDMKKKIDRKWAAVMVLVLITTGQVFSWGHPAGHSVSYYAMQAVLRGIVIGALTWWIVSAVFNAVDRNEKSDR
jgi:hypothetical protein